MSKKILKTDDNDKQMAYQLTNIASSLDKLNHTMKDLITNIQSIYKSDERWEWFRTRYRNFEDEIRREKMGKYFFAGLALVLLIIAVLT